MCQTLSRTALMKSNRLPVVALAALVLNLLLTPAAFSQSLLFSDNFDTDTAANWDLFNGSGSGTPDFTAEFNFDYSTHKIPPAPNSTGNSTRGVKLTVNNNDEAAEVAAVSLYPKGKTFSGNYALRFDMWMNYNGPAFGGTGSTEFSTFGLNHRGDKVNWANGEQSDGVWFAVSGEGGASRDYRVYEGLTGFAATELRGLDAGFLDRDGDGLAEFEVNPTQKSDTVLKSIFPSPPFETPGMPGKQWVQVEVQQKDGTLTWLINGYVMATRLNASEFLSGNVMIGYMDVFSSIANPRAENFVLYDNVRVVNLDAEPARPELAVEATDAEASEPGSNTGTFTISRKGPTTAALTVRFAWGGSATLGVDYATNALTATLAAGASSTTITVTPLNDARGEPTETVVLTLLSDPGYQIGSAFRATVQILDDNDITSVTVRATDSFLYERLAEDTGTFSIGRLGDDSTDLRVNFTVAGTATSGSDYEPLENFVVILAGQTNATVTVIPKDDALVEGDETILLTLAAGNEYVIGSLSNATLTLRDNDLPQSPVLFSDNFETDSSGNWTVQFGSGNGIKDFSTVFAHDYSLEGLPPAPNSTGGSTKGLKVTVNKEEPSASGAAGVNLYPKGQSFSGNFALRFDMYLSFASDVGGTTEHAIFGILHSGSMTNRHNVAGSDGLWFAVETDGSASGGGRSYVSYAAPGFVAKSARDFDALFTKPPYFAAGAASGQWVDVEVSHVGREVTWKINNSVIFQVNSPGDTTSGTIMLGHMDTFNSIGSLGNFTLFDNVRVVSLGAAAPSITIAGIRLLPDNRLQVDFTAGSGTAAQFALESAAVIGGPFAAAANAQIQAGTGAGQFQAVVPRPAAGHQFYRVRFQ